MGLEGIDVSAYQGSIEWQAVRDAGIRFAAIKATEGLDYRDLQFAANWSGAKAAGISRLAYHFLRAEEAPQQQASLLHDHVRTNGRFRAGDAVMLDFETLDGQEPRIALARAEVFVRQVWREIAKPVIVYTYPDFWLRLLGNPLSDVLSRCPLWIADYGSRPPSIPNWPRGYSFWQYTETGRVPGIYAAVDRSVFSGNLVQLKKIMTRFPQ